MKSGNIAPSNFIFLFENYIGYCSSLALPYKVQNLTFNLENLLVFWLELHWKYKLIWEELKPYSIKSLNLYLFGSSIQQFSLVFSIKILDMFLNFILTYFMILMLFYMTMLYILFSNFLLIDRHTIDIYILIPYSVTFKNSFMSCRNYFVYSMR